MPGRYAYMAEHRAVPALGVRTHGRTLSGAMVEALAVAPALDPEIMVSGADLSPTRAVP